MIIRKIRRTSQPQHPVGVYGTSLSDALIAVVLPSVRRELLNKNPLTIGANGSYIPNEKGVTIRGSGSSNVASLAADFSAYSTITITGIIKVDSWKTSSGQFDMLWELTSDGQLNNGGLTLYNSGSTSERLVMAHRGNSTGLARYTGFRPTAGEWHVITVIYNLDGNSVDEELQLYVDGVYYPTTGGGTALQTNGTKYANSTLNLLSRNASSLPTTGNLAGLFVHGRALSTIEIQRIANNHWQIFQPGTSFIPIGAAVGGATIDCGTGNAVAAGYTSGIASNVSILSGIGDATSAGFSASIASNVTISSGVASADATGYAANILSGSDVTINCAVGDASASGYAANIASNATISASIGSAVAAGYSSNIAENVTISAGAGNAEASGLLAGLSLNIIIPASIGDAVAAGYQASISGADVVNCGVGGSVADGHSASIGQAIFNEVYRNAKFSVAINKGARFSVSQSKTIRF